MLSEPKSFGQNVGVDLCQCPVAVLEDVVLVVQVGESFGQGQFVPEALVDPENQLAWRQLMRPAFGRQVLVRRLPVRQGCPLGRR